jgi:hypothetical protein
MNEKKDVMGRFSHIVRTLGKIYSLPPTSLHIFYDVSGSLIAFNAGGSLFCNLRYYEAWRMYSSVSSSGLASDSLPSDDADVARGDLSGAYISWSVPPFLRFFLDSDRSLISGTSPSHMRSPTTSCNRITRSTSSISQRFARRICCRLDNCFRVVHRVYHSQMYYMLISNWSDQPPVKTRKVQRVHHFRRRGAGAHPGIFTSSRSTVVAGGCPRL